ncbi:MAG: class I SAM-dependent methyltransferase [bacterium]|nr:class I SAM-dependent methyltransferase [bacterium]
MKLNLLPADTNPVLVEILQSKQVQTESGDGLPLHSHIPLLECCILQEWVKSVRPRRVLEIGFAYGISTMFLCDVLDWQTTEEYHVLDPHQARDWHHIGLLNLQRAGYGDKVQWHEKASIDILPRFISTGMLFDFILVDGSHQAPQVRLDAEQCDQLLSADGIIAFDDIQLPAVATAVSFLIRERAYTQLPIPDLLANALPIRIRRMNQVPVSRVVVLKRSQVE